MLALKDEKWFTEFARVGCKLCENALIGTGILAQFSRCLPESSVSYAVVLGDSTLIQTILIVDDEAMSRNLVRLMLENEKFQFFEASDGAEALEVAERERPDLILLDMLLPRMGGLALCEQLQARKETADIPVIVLSAAAQHNMVEQSKNMGVSWYLTKPVTRNALVQAVHDVLREQQLSSARISTDSLVS